MYRAIIVDDEPWSLSNVKSIFPWARYGFEPPLSVTNARDALDLALREKPDVLFTDIKMPEINGLDIIKYLRESGLKTKFVVISGYADFSFAQKSITYGVFSYLLKPIDRRAAENLMMGLKAALDRERSAGSQPNDYTNISNPAFKKLVRFVDEHYTEKLQLSDLSKRFQINASYCSQLFIEYFGCGFSEYVIGLKMQKAAELLANGDMWVSEISDFLNYDYVHFSKLFKKHFGVTPKQYRQKEGGSL